MKTCKKCGSAIVICDKIGGQFFVLCHNSQGCAGASKTGSPLSNGKATEAEAWAQARAERKVEG